VAVVEIVDIQQVVLVELVVVAAVVMLKEQKIKAQMDMEEPQYGHATHKQTVVVVVVVYPVWVGLE
jgi:hypothetical protein